MQVLSVAFSQLNIYYAIMYKVNNFEKVKSFPLISSEMKGFELGIGLQIAYKCLSTIGKYHSNSVTTA